MRVVVPRTSVLGSVQRPCGKSSCSPYAPKDSLLRVCQVKVLCGSGRRNVFTENLAHTSGNLPHGGAALDRLQDCRHNVTRGAGLLRNPVERRLPAQGIAAGAQRADALNLGPFRRLAEIPGRRPR